MSSPAGIVRWEDPPPRRTSDVYDWDGIADALMARPGQWALVVVCPNTATAGSTARHIRNGLYEAMPRGDFDATARTVDGEARVYARYVGEVATSG